MLALNRYEGLFLVAVCYFRLFYLIVVIITTLLSLSVMVN